MAYKSYGIIIRFSQKSRYKIAVLDYHQGRIDCITATIKLLSLGAVINYSMRIDRMTYFIDNIGILYLPLSLARTDLLFLHHILEILYCFVPAENCVPGMFELLSHLYQLDHTIITRHYKKIFLLELFILLGIAPEEAYVKEVRIVAKIILHQPQADMIDTALEKRIDQWLWYCIYQHPYGNTFKTIYFLDENRTA